MSSLALFEDSYWSNFLPMTLTKPTFDVKVGAKTFFEEYGQSPDFLITREFLASTTQERHSDSKVNPASVDADTVFVNGLLHPGAIDLQGLLNITHTFSITSGHRLLAARAGKKGAEYLAHCVAAGESISLKRLQTDKSTDLGMHESIGLLSNPWEIINSLENSLALQVSSSMEDSSTVPQGVTVRGKGGVTIAKGAEVENGTVFDATSGGIFVGPEAHIAPCRIAGPSYIGGMTQVKQFAVIESSYVGLNCRVSGEIEHSIVSDHSNKAHTGFLGHSYVGEWVNLGAMTTTSDLKMTYGNIKMNNGTGKNVDTGANKIGVFIGDMCKTSIGTLIYSGRRIGVSSHLHGLVSRDVPSYTIYGSGAGSENVELQISSALETQRRVMSRRGQNISKAYGELMRHIFVITAEDRKKSKVRKKKFVI